LKGIGETGVNLHGSRRRFNYGRSFCLVSGLFTAAELENGLIYLFRERTKKTEMEKSGVE